MAKQVTVIRVFLASPSDVADERIVFDEVLAEVNALVAEDHNVLLSPVKFETHARPGIGVDAQDVINTQIGDSYDVFVGILWQRFGTPTARAESGTEEEFNRALARYNSSPRNLRVMFYFKTAAVDPMKLDLEQFAKVAAFRKRIEGDGVLWWSFSSVDDFRIQLRGHLAVESKQFGESWGTREQQVKTNLPPETQARLMQDDEEPGIVELILEVQDSSSLGIERMEAFTKKQSRLTERLATLKSDLDESDMSTRAGIVKAKRAFERAASAMMAFATDVEKEMPQICDSSIKMAESISKAVVLGGPDLITDTQRESLIAMLSATSNSIQQFRDVITGVRESIPVKMGVMSGPMRTAVSALKRALSQAETLLAQARSAVEAAAQLMST